MATTRVPMTFGLIEQTSKPKKNVTKNMETYTVTVLKYHGLATPSFMNGYDRVYSIRASSIVNLRRKLIQTYAGNVEENVVIEVQKLTVMVGVLDIKRFDIKWRVAGRNNWVKVDPKTGKLRRN